MASNNDPYMKKGQRGETAIVKHIKAPSVKIAELMIKAKEFMFRIKGPVWQPMSHDAPKRTRGGTDRVNLDVRLKNSETKRFTIGLLGKDVPHSTANFLSHCRKGGFSGKSRDIYQATNDQDQIEFIS